MAYANVVASAQTSTAPLWEREPTRPRLTAITLAGRRHLTSVPYALPKDASEINRLDFQRAPSLM